MRFLRSLAIVSAIFATSALAQPVPRGDDPKTVELPTSFVIQLNGYLRQRPVGEVEPIMMELRACIAAQTPNRAGIVTFVADCQAVSQARQDRAITGNSTQPASAIQPAATKLEDAAPQRPVSPRSVTHGADMQAPAAPVPAPAAPVPAPAAVPAPGDVPAAANDAAPH